MSSSEREGLIARIRQLRRVSEPSATRAGLPETQSDDEGRDLLEARVLHLEQMVLGLQDSVHRETSRHSERIAELEAQIQPSALSRALSEDARNRGL
jgi:hypothetical protein